jgi:hypothetical protein
MIIQQDSIGLYGDNGSWIVRPINPTRYSVGYDIAEYHFGGTPLHGVGKDDSCKRGEYLEIWIGNGLSYECKTQDELIEAKVFYDNLITTKYCEVLIPQAKYSGRTLRAANDKRIRKELDDMYAQSNGRISKVAGTSITRVIV